MRKHWKVSALNKVYPAGATNCPKACFRMRLGWKPEIYPWHGETGGFALKEVDAFQGQRGACVSQMEEAEFLRDVFKCDIVGDNVLFQSGRERFSESRIRVQIMECFCGCDKEVRAQLSFGG